MYINTKKDKHDRERELHLSRAKFHHSWCLPTRPSPSPQAGTRTRRKVIIFTGPEQGGKQQHSVRVPAPAAALLRGACRSVPQRLCVAWRRRCQDSGGARGAPPRPRDRRVGRAPAACTAGRARPRARRRRPRRRPRPPASGCEPGGGACDLAVPSLILPI